MISTKKIRGDIFLISTILFLPGVLETSLANNVPEEDRLVDIYGTVVCLDKSDQSLVECNPSSTNFALITAKATRYLFSPNDPKSGALLDPRIQKETLRVIGWVRQEQLEIKKLLIVQEKGLVEIFYRCDVCNITAFSPGPCWCCREAFKLRLEPYFTP